MSSLISVYVEMSSADASNNGSIFRLQSFTCISWYDWSLIASAEWMLNLHAKELWGCWSVLKASTFNTKNNECYIAVQSNVTAFQIPWKRNGHLNKFVDMLKSRQCPENNVKVKNTFNVNEVLLVFLLCLSNE